MYVKHAVVVESISLFLCVAFQELKSEKELVEYLLTVYNDVVHTGSDVTRAAQRLVNISVHFFKSPGVLNPQVRTSRPYKQMFSKFSMNNTRSNPDIHVL